MDTKIYWVHKKNLYWALPRPIQLFHGPNIFSYPPPVKHCITNIIRPGQYGMMEVDTEIEAIHVE